MNLNIQNEGEEQTYKINNKAFPETENLEVKEGYLVKLNLINNSTEDNHPMHLHDHFFQVLSKN